MFKVYKYSFPFSQPFKTGAGTLNKREGLIIQYAEKGSEFLSEIAPLPGFSIETIHDVSDVLTSNKNSWNLSSPVNFQNRNFAHF